MSLLDDLSNIVKKAFEKCNINVEGRIVKLSDRPDLSQFQCNAAFEKAKEMKQNPRALAEQIVEELKNESIFKEVSVAGPGFINFTLNDEYISKYIGENFDTIDLTKYNSEKKKIIVDYGGPNVAKPLHVGHLRPAIIGEGLKRLAKALGNDVIGDVHLGDWGRQMGMVISEIKHMYPDLVYFDENYDGVYPDESPVTVDDLNEIYPAANAKAKEDEDRMEEARLATAILQNDDMPGHNGYYELWKQLVKVSVEDLKKSYDKLNVHFDLWKGESDCQKLMPEMMELLKDKNILAESEGALVVFVEEDTDTTPIPPAIIRTKSNSIGYQATDIATIYERMKEYNPDEIWYVVDARQDLHFKQVFRTAYKAGIANENTVLYFAGFGTMNGKDGKPFKTRDGGVMRLSELLEQVEEVALSKMSDYITDEQERIETAKILADASIKYADAISNRRTDYIFDMDKFTDNTGKTGPYALYSVVRIKSLLDKAQNEGLIDGVLKKPTSKDELDVMLEIAKLPDALMEGYKNKSLSEIVNYIFDLDSAYNNFYNNCKILSEEDKEKQASWLKLSKIVKEINEKLLDIMAIRIPNRM